MIGTAIHYIGSLLLLAGVVFLLIASISAPAVNSINFVKIAIENIDDSPYLSLGAFGWCVVGDGGKCSGAHVGYNAAKIIGDDGLGQTNNLFSDAREGALKALTHVFVLHPIAGAVILVGFLLSLKTGFLNIVTALISFFGFILTIVCLAVDATFSVFIRHDVNNEDSRYKATFGIALWMVVAAAASTLLGTIIVFITCCAGRRRSRYENRKVGY